MKALGKTRWAIAEGYIPSTSTGPEPEMTSHETVCVLNPSDDDATVPRYAPDILDSDRRMLRCKSAT